MTDEEFYRDHVAYKSYTYPDEKLFYSAGGKDYNFILEWIDDEREDLEKEFEHENNSFKDFGLFCLHKWIDGKYEM